MRSLLAGVAWAVPAIPLSAQTAFRDSVELNPIVVTASHTPKTLKDAPVVTRLITLHDIKIADATNIQDMLIQEVPGLEFGFAMGQETSLNMSGFGGNAVLFLVDGERMAGETMDNVDYSRMNLDNVGRIEIVKGASSALYGSNAVGGVVNIISRENLEPWTANANTRYNSFGHEWRHGASFSFNTEKWNSQTSFQHTAMDPVDLPKAHTSEEIAIELMKKAQGLPYDESVLNDDSNLSRLYGQKTYNVKERLTWRATDRLTLIGRGGYFFRTSERDTYDYHFNAYSAGLKGRYAWDNSRHLELSYAYDQYDKANFQPDGTRTHDHDYSNRQHVAHALYSHPFGKNTLILGADYLHDYLTTYQFADNTSHSQNNIDGYAQFDWNITRQLNVVGSIRYDYFSASAQKALTDAQGDRGDGPGKIPESAFTTLQNAVTQAQTIVNENKVNQAAVNDETASLLAAITTFQSSRVANDYTALQALVDEATNLIADALAGKLPYLQEDLDELKASLEKNAAALESTDQDVINRAAKLLKRDIALFKNLSDAISGIADDSRIQVRFYDLNGLLISTSRRNLRKGTYVMIIENEGKQVIRKILINE